MKGYGNILLATDFSEPGERAVLRAADIARRLDAQLTVLHVIDYFPENIPPDIDTPEDQDPKGFLVQRLRSTLATLADRCGLNNALQKVILTNHTARKEIIRYAKNHHIDLIIIATHGHHGVTPFLGSTADRVVRGASCDVLAVRAGENVQRPGDYSRILGATDFLDHSFTAVRRVTELVKSYHAALILLHVVEYSPETLFPEWIGTERVDYFTDTRIRAARDALRELADEIECPEANQQTITTKGTAAQEITRFATQQDIDLIAVGAYGHYGVDFLLGSTAERVLHGASCDVLVARLPGSVKGL